MTILAGSINVRRGENPEVIGKKYKALLQECLGMNIANVHVCCIPEHPDPEIANATQQLNTYLCEKCEDLDIHFIDNQIPLDMSYWHGIHLSNPDGVALLASAIKQAFRYYYPPRKQNNNNGRYKKSGPRKPMKSGQYRNGNKMKLVADLLYRLAE